MYKNAKIHRKRWINFYSKSLHTNIGQNERI